MTPHTEKRQNVKLKKENARLQRELELMRQQLLQGSKTPTPSVRWQAAPCEGGDSMEPFIELMEHRFKKMHVPQQCWGDELVENLAEDAL